MDEEIHKYLESQKPLLVRDRRHTCSGCGNKYNNQIYASCPYCAEDEEDPNSVD